MQNETNLYQNIFAKAGMSKRFWLPTLLGVATMSMTTGWPFWLGAAAVVTGVGSFFWDVTVGQDRLRNQVLQEAAGQANQEHYEYLRDLQRRLRNDSDPKTGNLLRDLRDVHKRSVELGVFGTSQEITWKSELHEKLKRLYDSSVKSLEKSFDLWKKSQRVQAADSKQQFVDSRQTVLDEVATSTHHIQKALDQLELEDSDVEIEEQNLTSLREELDVGLEVARNVDARISLLEKEIQRVIRE